MKCREESRRVFCISALMVALATLVEPADASAQEARIPLTAQRMRMVNEAVKGAGITDPAVLRSIQETPRHEFMPRDMWDVAYMDAGIPIGAGQTISSPFIVAYMTESLGLQSTDKVLEIGTGSGYQAAVLSPLVDAVYSIEILRSLGMRAARVLQRLGYENVHVKIGDGFEGWPEHAPFDKIIVTCSPETIPVPLKNQLREGGLIVIPMGERHQQTLYLLKKVHGELESQPLRPTLFVPMTGQAEGDRRVRPDGAHPELANGNFEDGLDEEGFVKGWYYQRRCEWRADALTSGGRRYVQFENAVPGQFAWLMQGLAIDGRSVRKIRLSASVACDRVAIGNHPDELPVIAIQYLDSNRDSLSVDRIGPFKGSKAWTNHHRDFRVPVDTREAILRIGLFGATGKASFDDITITARKP